MSLTEEARQDGHLNTRVGTRGASFDNHLLTALSTTPSALDELESTSRGGRKTGSPNLFAESAPNTGAE